jgi:predicted DNA-binding antitoxin AbrB/MazE fold protein
LRQTALPPRLLITLRGGESGGRGRSVPTVHIDSRGHFFSADRRSINGHYEVEAIYSNGVFIPTQKLGLRDEQRVRLTVEKIDEPNGDRAAAVARLKAGIASMNFFSQEALPKRDDLHRCR